MNIMVPLAGPDFDRADGSTKAEQIFQGKPLLRAVLESRPWWDETAHERLVMVLRDSPTSRRFAREALRLWYPGVRVAFLGASTRGAALTLLAGLSMVGHDEVPLCLDLADIYYRCDFNPIAAFANQPDLGGALTVFPSDLPFYSYAALDTDGNVARTAEKTMISNHASAGTYFFRSSAVLLRALSYSLDDPAAVTFNNLFYICPLMNGVVAQSLRVIVHSVAGVQDVKLAPAA